MAKKKTTASVEKQPRATKGTTHRNPSRTPARSGPMFYACEPCGVATLIDECPAHGKLERVPVEAVRFALQPVPATVEPVSEAQAKVNRAVLAHQDEQQTTHRQLY